MSAQLKDMLTSVADEQRARVDARRPETELDAYVRAIRPRRAARRAGLAATALVGVGLAGAGYLVLGSPSRTVGPAVDTPTPEATALVPDPDAIAGEPGWTVAGAVIDPSARAMAIAEVAGAPAGESVACGAVDAFGRLEGGDGWAPSVPQDLGAFVGRSGSATAVHLRSIGYAPDADAYLVNLKSIAETCAADLESAGVQAVVSRVAFTALPGEAVQVSIPAGGSDWTLTVHVDGEAAIAIVADPGAEVTALDVIAAWVEGAVG